MTPKETLDKIANIEYDNKLTADAFLYMAEGEYSYKLEDVAIKAIHQYHQEQSSELIGALVAIAKITDGELILPHAAKTCQDIANKAIQNIKL